MHEAKSSSKKSAGDSFTAQTSNPNAGVFISGRLLIQGCSFPKRNAAHLCVPVREKDL